MRAATKQGLCCASDPSGVRSTLSFEKRSSLKVMVGCQDRDGDDCIHIHTHLVYIPCRTCEMTRMNERTTPYP